MTRVGIVGGGITGLSLLHSLEEEGFGGLVFEASSEPGGMIQTIHQDGRVLETGPQRMRYTPAIGRLLDDLGLQEEILVADPSLPLFVFCDGALRVAPFSLREFVMTDLFTLRGKLRILAEPLTGPGRPDEMAAALFSRKFGHEAYAKFIGPLFGGLYGSDPAEMPARHALDRILQLEAHEGCLLWPVLRHLLRGESIQSISFEAGLAHLPKTLADSHHDRVRLKTHIDTIHEEGSQFQLVTDGGEQFSAESVVLTTPAPETAALLGSLAPEAARRLEQLTYNPLVIVHLQAETHLHGQGYQVCPDEGLSTLGVSWNDSTFGRDGIFTAFLGGMRRPSILERSDAEIGRIAREEFRTVTGVEATVLNVTRRSQGVPAYDQSWDALEGLELPDGIRLATNFTGRLGIPSRVREARELSTDLVASATD